MDLSCIISSGDLELYVLGLLPEEDSQKIERLMELLPEIREEVDRISETLEVLANSGEATPRAEVKTKFYSQLAELQNTYSKENGATSSLKEKKKINEPAPVVPMYARSGTKLFAASIIALVVCISALIYFAIETAHNKQQVALLNQQIENVEKSERENSVAYHRLLNIVSNPEYNQINLQNVPGKPEGLARVFWNRRTSTVYILDVSLPPTPAGKQYQLWAIVNGQPIDAGLISAGQKMQQMRGFESADAFAITLENEGGSATPTLEELYVMGETS